MASAQLKKIARRLLGPRRLTQRALAREIAQGEPEIRLIPSLADPQGTFIDIGANQGVYAMCAQSHFARVVAVEAHPDLANWLTRALGSKAEIRHTALSDSEGIAELHVPVMDDAEILTRCSLNSDANPGFGLRHVEVPMTSLDALAIDNVRVIKIDVEGHEFAVLRGARSTLSRWHPVCIVEVEERHNAGGTARAFSFFEELGYKPWFVHRGALRPGGEFDPAQLQNPDNAIPGSGVRSPDYINNFIFVHESDQESLPRLREALGRS